MTEPRPQTLHTPEATRADAALRAGRVSEALAMARAFLRKVPRDPELRFILAQSLTRTNAPGEAVPHLQKLSREFPEHTGFRVELANALDGSGHPEQALQELDRVLQTNPDHDFAIRIRVKLLRGVGRAQQAWDELSARLETLPRTVNIALGLGFVLPKDADPAPVLARLGEVASDESIALPNRRASWYAIAKIQERAAQYDEAFAAAANANALLTAGQADLHHAAMFEQLTPELVESIEPADLDASGVALVCGMPRSGTTLTEQILAAHPSAASAGEFNALPLAVNDVLKPALTGGIVPRELTTKVAKGYLKALRQRAGDPSATLLIDKLPSNHLILALAARLLPGVRIVRCVRDPRDIAVSCYFQDFGSRHAYRARLDTLADELLLHERAAARWRTELGDTYLEHALESLIADPEPVARRLVAHAGLGWDDACLRFHEQGAHVRTASSEQVRSGINASGVGRWKNYEKHLAPLLERLTQSPMNPIPTPDHD
ncbi:MAG: tetratricopeptide (TPR) repeat protein [Phycisphaerales bacterium]|jgi:tetratricopeptide (TPR) repeat protein